MFSLKLTNSLPFLQRLLVACIEERLRALEEPCGALQVEMRENGVWGEAVEALVRERCTPVELERYSLFIGDLERVVSLLLCLSSRLARVQNALSTVDQHTDEEEKVRETETVVMRSCFQPLIGLMFTWDQTCNVQTCWLKKAPYLSNCETLRGIVDVVYLIYCL